MRVRISIVLAALAVTMVLPGTVGARSADAAAKAARAEHNRIVNYWTAERMAAAKHKDFVRNGAGLFRLVVGGVGDEELHGSPAFPSPAAPSALSRRFLHASDSAVALSSSSYCTTVSMGSGG